MICLYAGKMINLIGLIDDIMSISGRSSTDGSAMLCKQNMHDGMADRCLTSLLQGIQWPKEDKCFGDIKIKVLCLIKRLMTLGGLKPPDHPAPLLHLQLIDYPSAGSQA